MANIHNLLDIERTFSIKCVAADAFFLTNICHRRLDNPENNPKDKVETTDNLTEHGNHDIVVGNKGDIYPKTWEK